MLSILLAVSEGVAEDCCMLSILLAVSSCFNSFWHGLIPTSYFIFIFTLVHKDLNTCHLANFIGLRFFDAIRIEAKSDSEEMTGDLKAYIHT